MKYKNVPELDIQPGDEVRFTKAKAHEAIPEYNPAPGTCGKVMGVDEHTGEVQVLWPKESGVKRGLWWCVHEWIAFVSRTSVPA